MTFQKIAEEINKIHTDHWLGKRIVVIDRDICDTVAHWYVEALTGQWHRVRDCNCA